MQKTEAPAVSRAQEKRTTEALCHFSGGWSLPGVPAHDYDGHAGAGSLPHGA